MFFLGNRRWEYDLLYSQSMGGVVDTGRTPTSPHTTAVPMDSINLREWLALIAMVGFNHFARGVKHLGNEFERGEKGTLHFKDAQLLIAFGYMSDTTGKLFFGQKFPGRHVKDRFDRDFRATLYSLREGLKKPITLVDVMVRLAIDERAIKALLSPTEFTTWFGVWNQEPWDLPKKYVEEMDFYFNPVHVVLRKPLEVWDFVAYSEATSRVYSHYTAGCGHQRGSTFADAHAASHADTHHRHELPSADERVLPGWKSAG